MFYVFFFKQKTAYEMRISDWSSDVCSSDLPAPQDSWLWRVRRSQDQRFPRGRGGGRLPTKIFRQPRHYDRCGQGGRRAACSAEPRKGGSKIGRASCRERVCQYV